MTIRLNGTALLWSGFALAITTLLLWYITKGMLANTVWFAAPSPYAIAVALLFIITLIATFITLVTGAVLKAVGR